MLKNMESSKDTQIEQKPIEQTSRKSRMEGIRSTMKLMPVLKKNTEMVEKKMQRNRKRKQSVQITPLNVGTVQDQDFADSPDIRNSFQERYQMEQKIGQGVHGVVKKCRHKTKGLTMAVKIIKLNDEHIPILKNGFVDVKNLSHPNIIKHKAMYFDYKKNLCYLVMEYIDMPNLLQIQVKTQQDLKFITIQLLDALSYMHKNGICHRDIKPENILFDPVTKVLKLIDFGICKNLYKRGRFQEMLTVTGTLYYRAPEMFHGSYDLKVDLWALGVTLYKLITGKTPFQSIYTSQTIANIENGQLDFQNKAFDQYTYMVKNFISRLIRKKREQRLTADAAKKHFWFEPKVVLEDNLTKSQSFKLCQIKNYQIHREEQQTDQHIKRKKSYEDNDKKEPSTSDTLPSFKEKQKVKKFFSFIDIVEQKQFASDEQIDIKSQTKSETKSDAKSDD